MTPLKHSRFRWVTLAIGAAAVVDDAQGQYSKPKKNAAKFELIMKRGGDADTLGACAQRTYLGSQIFCLTKVA
jgi:hypothetical protein